MALRQANLSSNGGLGLSGSIKLPDSPNLRFSEFGVPVFFSENALAFAGVSKNAVTMFQIFRRSDYLKIFKAVISFYAVLVVRLQSIWNRHESRKDGPVSVDVFLNAVYRKANDHVSTSSNGWRHDLSSTAFDSSKAGGCKSSPTRNVGPSFVRLSNAVHAVQYSTV